MTASETTFDLPAQLAMIGEAGERISEIGAAEAAAGNISVFMTHTDDLSAVMPDQELITLPVPAPALVGGVLLVTGSGRRLRQLGRDPLASIGAVTVMDDGLTATLHTAPQRRFATLTSEVNSHLAVHQDQVRARQLEHHAVVHAQPTKLTYLSHIPSYRTTTAMNAALLRWEPETIVSLSDGIGVLPFAVPGSADMGELNLEGLRAHRLVVWSKHGTMSRSDESVLKAVDLVEYAEAAAAYEVTDLMCGQRAEGITAQELLDVSGAFSIDSPWI